MQNEPSSAGESRLLQRLISTAHRVLAIDDVPVVAELVAAAEGDSIELLRAEDGRPFDLLAGDADNSVLTGLLCSLEAGAHVCIDFHRALAQEPPDALRASLRSWVVRLAEAGFAVVEPRAIRDPAAEWEAGRATPLVIARRDRFTIRTYAEGDEKAILSMFPKAFYVERSLEHWEWEYRRNPYSTLNMSLVVDEEGRLVVHYAAYPVRVWSPRAPYPTIAMQIGDTMTDVGVRHVGRGHTTLLCRAIRHFYATRCEEKVAYAFGFNTANIQKICTLYIGGSRVEAVGHRIRSLDAPPKPPWSSLLRGRVTAAEERVGEEFDRFFARVAPSYGMLIERSAEYLRWRYESSPAAQYVLIALRRKGQLVGWSVFRRRNEDLVWVDALFERDHARDAATEAVRAALALPIARGAASMLAWFPDRPSWWSAIVAELGFRSEQEPNDLAIVAAPFTDPDAPVHLATEYYYTCGDSDLF